MIHLLVDLFGNLGWKLPYALTSVSFRMVLAAISSMTLTVVLGKTFISALCSFKIGHRMRVGEVAVLAEDYNKDEDVPSMGGVLFLSTVIISAVCWMDLTHFFTFILVLTVSSMGLLGAVDDILKLHGKGKGVPPIVKLIVQGLLGGFICLYLFVPSISSALPLKIPRAKEHAVNTKSSMKELSSREYASRYYIPFVKKPFVVSGVGIIAASILSLVVIAGSANAVNLTDGLDGLASGLVLLTALVLAGVAFLSNHIEIARYLNIIYIEGASEIAIFLSALAGSLLGFLWYNSYPAQVFMGDTGSLALGGILGVCAILLRREFLFALIGGVFVIETLSVILQVLSFRIRKGKRIFLCAPIHHHFQMKGWHESKVVIRFWMLGLLFALIGIASLKFQ